jgi:hypothetical protein
VREIPSRESGGTGRRAGFRILWAHTRGGSSPPFRTPNSRTAAVVAALRAMPDTRRRGHARREGDAAKRRRREHRDDHDALSGYESRAQCLPTTSLGGPRAGQASETSGLPDNSAIQMMCRYWSLHRARTSANGRLMRNTASPRSMRRGHAMRSGQNVQSGTPLRHHRRPTSHAGLSSGQARFLVRL